MKRKTKTLSLALALTLFVGCGESSPAQPDQPIFDDCGPDVTYEDCYRDKRDPSSDQIALALELARRHISIRPIDHPDNAWDWRAGVWMFALTELYRVTGAEDIHDYYQAWMDYRIEQGYDIVWSDSCPPGITSVTLLNEDSEASTYRQVVDDIFTYLDDVAPRTAENGISHNGILGNVPSIWLDSLFMFGMVLNRWGEDWDDTRLDMMAEQIGIFGGVLQDENGFMRHAQDWPGYDESVYWARGNSWVVASLSDYLRIRVRRGETDPGVARIFTDHVAAILSAQQESGLWLTVMSHPEEPDNYLETSASALFAYGVARAFRYGILGDEERALAQKTVQSIDEMMIRRDPDGPVVTQVSIFTDPWSLEEYLAVPVRDDVNYGVGAVILALIETSGLPE